MILTILRIAAKMRAKVASVLLSQLKYDKDFNFHAHGSKMIQASKDDFVIGFSTGGTVGKQSNGSLRGKESKSGSSKNKRRIYDSDEAGENGSLGMHITEDHYRAMLGEHIQKYQRRLKDFSSPPASARTGIPPPRTGRSGSKTRKSGIEQRRIMCDLETASEWPKDNAPKNHGNGYEEDFLQTHRSDRFVMLAISSLLYV